MSEPSVVDMRIAELESEVAAVMRPAGEVFWRARKLLRVEESYGSRSPRPQRLVEMLQEDGSSSARGMLAELAALEDKAAPLRAETDELEELWWTERWSRFFLVVSSADGHIHDRRSCSTCRFDTVFSWLPELSGLSEADAVEAYGAILCTVCFPSAPVEWTGGESKASIEAREERERAKAEREAKKDAKRLVPGSDDGIVVTKYGRSERLKTVAAAKSFLTDGYENFYGPGPWDGERYLPEDRDTVAALLLGRPGLKETTVEEILAAAAKRAAKRK